MFQHDFDSSLKSKSGVFNQEPASVQYAVQLLDNVEKTKTQLKAVELLLEQERAMHARVLKERDEALMKLDELRGFNTENDEELEAALLEMDRLLQAAEERANRAEDLLKKERTEFTIRLSQLAMEQAHTELDRRIDVGTSPARPQNQPVWESAPHGRHDTHNGHPSEKTGESAIGGGTHGAQSAPSPAPAPPATAATAPSNGGRPLPTSSQPAAAAAAPTPTPAALLPAGPAGAGADVGRHPYPHAPHPLPHPHPPAHPQPPRAHPSADSDTGDGASPFFAAAPADLHAGGARLSAPAVLLDPPPVVPRPASTLAVPSSIPSSAPASAWDVPPTVPVLLQHLHALSHAESASFNHTVKSPGAEFLQHRRERAAAQRERDDVRARDGAQRLVNDAAAHDRHFALLAGVAATAASTPHLSFADAARNPITAVPCASSRPMKGNPPSGLAGPASLNSSGPSSGPGEFGLHNGGPASTSHGGVRSTWSQPGRPPLSAGSLTLATQRRTSAGEKQQQQPGWTAAGDGWGVQAPPPAFHSSIVVKPGGFSQSSSSSSLSHDGNNQQQNSWML